MRNEVEQRRSRLVPRLHTAVDGTPYFDEGLQVAQSTAHRIMAVDLSAILATVGAEAELTYLSDEPIWYISPDTDEQKVYYGDIVLARAVDTTRITADDLLFVMEIVSTNDRRRELKDTRFQRFVNEYNDVPEFALAFPEVEDPRALTWYELVDGEYLEHIVGPGGQVESRTIPGLALKVLPRAEWRPGHKFDVFYRGEVRPGHAEERARAEQERDRAEQERDRAEQERDRAEQERARAEQGEARAEQERARAEQGEARAEQERARAERERARAEQEEARAEQERARAEQERARAEALASRLRELGVDPDA